MPFDAQGNYVPFLTGGSVSQTPTVSESETAFYQDPLTRSQAILNRVSYATQAFEPLQFSQDLFFNATADFLDPLSGSTTMFERSRQQFQNIQAYAPFGDVPERLTTGQDMARLLGVEGEQRQKYIGLGLDVFADPLAAGSYVRAVNKFVGLTGDAKKFSDGLSRALDTTANLTNVSNPLGIGFEVYRNIKPVKKLIDDRAILPLYALAGQSVGGSGSVRTIGDFLSLAPILPRTEQRTAQVANELQRGRGIFGDSSQINTQLSDRLDATIADPSNNFVSRFDVIRSESQDLTLGLRGAEARGTNTSNDLLEVDGALRVLMGQEFADDFLSNSYAPLLQATDNARRLSRSSRNERVQEVVAQGWSTLADNFGIGTILRGANDDGILTDQLDLLSGSTPLRSLAQQDLFSASRSDISSRVTGLATPTNQVDRATDAVLTQGQLYEKTINNIKRVAIDEGVDDVDALLDDFHEGWRLQALADMRGALTMSGYTVARDVFTTTLRANSLGGLTAREAEQSWVSLLRAGRSLDEKSYNNLRFRDVVPNPAALPASLAKKKIRSFRDNTGTLGNEVIGNTRTLRDVATPEGTIESPSAIGLRTKDLYTSLDVMSMTRAVAQGHLTQVYGAYNDFTTFTKMDKLRGKHGGVLTSNLILNGTDTGLQNFRSNAEFAHVENYISTLAPTGRSVRAGRDARAAARAIGTTASDTAAPVAFRPEGLQSYLSSISDAAGNPLFTRDTAKQYVDELISAASPEYAAHTQRMAKYAAKKLTQVNTGTGTQSLLNPASPNKKRKDLDVDLAEYLVPLANPQLSLQTQAKFAKENLTIYDSMKVLSDFADENALIWRGNPADAPRNFQRLPNSMAFGAMKGQLVSPVVFREATLGLKDITQVQSRVGRLRNLITGGFLTGPSVITANIVGSNWQATSMGFDPVDHANKMAKTWIKYFDKKSTGKDFFELEMLQTKLPLSNISMSREVAKQVSTEVSSYLGGSKEGFGEHISKLAALIEGQIKRPGTGFGNNNVRNAIGGALGGLDAFQMTEIMTRNSVFEMSMESLLQDASLKKLSGWKEYNALTAGTKARYDEIYDAAAQDARMANFDYQELPRYLEWASKAGLAPFAGFEFLLPIRNVKAAIENPASISVYDNGFDAYAETQVPDEVERGKVYYSMMEWTINDGGLPINQREDDVYRVMPMRQLIPIGSLEKLNDGRRNILSTLGPSSGFLQSVGAGGLWSPLLDMALAVSSGDGQSRLKPQFGQQVFRDGASNQEIIQDTAGFAFNSFVPGVVRRAVGTYDPRNTQPLNLGGGALSLPQARLNDAGYDLPQDLIELDLTVKEAVRSRNERGRSDAILGFFLRSITPVSTGEGSSSLPDIQRIIASEQRQIRSEINAMEKQMQIEGLTQNDAKYQELMGRANRRVEAFSVKWSEILSYYQQ